MRQQQSQEDEIALTREIERLDLIRARNPTYSSPYGNEGFDPSPHTNIKHPRAAVPAQNFSRPLNESSQNNSIDNHCLDFPYVESSEEDDYPEPPLTAIDLEKCARDARKLLWKIEETHSFVLNSHPRRKRCRRRLRKAFYRFQSDFHGIMLQSGWQKPTRGPDSDQNTVSAQRYPQFERTSQFPEVETRFRHGVRPCWERRSKSDARSSASQSSAHSQDHYSKIASLQVSPPSLPPVTIPQSTISIPMASTSMSGETGEAPSPISPSYGSSVHSDLQGPPSKKAKSLPMPSSTHTVPSHTHQTVKARYSTSSIYGTLTSTSFPGDVLRSTSSDEPTVAFSHQLTPHSLPMTTAGSYSSSAAQNFPPDFGTWASSSDAWSFPNDGSLLPQSGPVTERFASSAPITDSSTTMRLDEASLPSDIPQKSRKKPPKLGSRKVSTIDLDRTSWLDCSDNTAQESPYQKPYSTYFGLFPGTMASATTPISSTAAEAADSSSVWGEVTYEGYGSTLDGSTLACTQRSMSFPAITGDPSAYTTVPDPAITEDFSFGHPPQHVSPLIDSHYLPLVDDQRAPKEGLSEDIVQELLLRWTTLPPEKIG